MNFSASGKLLLFGEYLVLRGALCLAIPLRFGQKMSVSQQEAEGIHWIARAEETIWFSATFSKDLNVIQSSNSDKAEAIRDLLIFLKTKNTAILDSGLNIETQTNFPIEWGFGTSSTLVSLLSKWSEIDPYIILKNSFGGSGYDVACANADHPILYKTAGGVIESVELAKAVTSQTLFIFSGKKQATTPEVERFNTLEITADRIEKMNQIISTA